MKRLFNVVVLAVILALILTAVETPVDAAYAAENTGQSFSPLMTPNTWNALGSGLNSYVNAIAVSGTDVYVGGAFTDAGGDVNADRIAKWDGTSWSALGTGLNGQVFTIAVRDSYIYAGGNFTDAGGDVNADYIAQWDGSSWSSLGNGLNASPNVIAVSGSNVYVGGQFTDAGGNSDADYIVKLDGGTWESLGTTPLSASVSTMVVSGAEVYVGGGFLNAGGDANADYLAKWDGSSWSALVTTPLTGSVQAIVISGSDLYAGGQFTNAGGDPNADYIAKWDGSSWVALGGALNGQVSGLIMNGSNFYAGGAFTTAGGDTNANYIARWDGSSWSAVGNGLNGPVKPIVISGADLYAGGNFVNAFGNPNADYIAGYEIDVNTPTVSSFTATSPSTSPNIPITEFTASDNDAVSKYLITDSSIPPAADVAGWTASAPTTYTVASDGSYTLYPWAKDASGNVSAVYGSPVTIDVDSTAPTVTSFTVPSSSTSLDIPITEFTVSDTIGVAGYLITESNTPPDEGAGGWIGSAPTIYTVASEDSYTLYPWAKDTAGNISAVHGSPANVTVDATAPVITINNPTTSPAMSKTITASASDGTLTMSNTTGSTCDDSLSFIAYASQTFTAESDNGTKVCYKAVDTLSNTAYSLSDAIAGIDTTAPVITINNPNTSPATSKTITASASDGTLTMSNTTGFLCDGSLSFVAYASQTFTSESNNGTKVCYKAVDAPGNAAYSLSNAIAGIDTTAPVITVNNPNTSPGTSKTITASASDGTLTMSNTTGFLCDGSLSFVAYASQTFTSESNNGTKVCYKAVDSPGNTVYSLSNAIAGIDTTVPTVTSFTAPSLSSSLDIPITDFSASDTIGVTGYLITESSTAPTAGDSGWSGTAPAIYTVGADGNYTLYPWAKDALGNISAVYGSPATVNVDILLTVMNTNDSGAGSLRDILSNAGPGDTVTFDASLSGGTIYLASTLTVSSNVTIDGSALASQITISGDSDNNGTGDVRVFTVDSGVTATLDSLTITKGSATTAGGIYNNSASTLTITNSTLSDNRTTGGPGGGIRNDGTLTITNSTFSNNTTWAGSGGGIRNAGALTVTNSTFYNNRATGSGGGIYNVSGFTSLTITNSTFSGNQADSSGGGIYYTSTGTFSYANTIIANSTSGGDCTGDTIVNIVTNTNNLVEDGSCSNNGTNFIIGDPNLGTLADNGGSTQTFELLTGSPAIDAGDNITCAGAPNNLDQRGMTRPQGSQCDIGAFEVDTTPPGDTTAPSVDTFTASSTSNSLDISITAFTASDDTAVTGYLITESDTQPASAASGWSASAPTTFTVASDGSYTLYPWAKDAAGNVSAEFGSPVTVTVDTTAPDVTIDSQPTDPSASADASFTFSSTDGTATFECDLDGAGYASCSSPMDYTGLSNGSHTFSVSATDTVGNTGTADTYTWAINNSIASTFKSIATEDGWILESSETSNKGGSLNSTANLLYVGDNSQDKQYKSLLSFNTIGLPDNNITITSVKLRIKIQGFTGGNMFTPTKTHGNLLVDIGNPDFGTNANLAVSDFQATASLNNVGVMGSAPDTGWRTITLKSTAYNLINLAGKTQFRLRFQTDDNNDMANDFMKIFSGNAPAASRPQLIVEYHVP